ncbi:P-loop containing nucleoside triphosphate hydrolase protein [Gloeophyllum trabeum ATCC 11539]|uniref:DNA 3'-5' helicase n=1 Tax=Gloeophyllum trabeum (strain ATCC 11539 / FP-39264 / Madison 617) TaxID=670483 RepID=S7RPQ3_GLOTA|nr:P-loop containing nucleoside triphosphate hydrolase protein [Gloeophyllum trabeum ATCC 11539]EPQ54869.1 P-loop containing nucleoside triphosphate hydrolase protein [Gloeophyllum trabeum ATCC 11539]
MPSSSQTKWSIKKIRDLTEQKFRKRACLFQVKVAQAIRERRKDVVAVAATGFGKTLAFWTPLLMAMADGEDRCIIVVSPLNLLGRQNVQLLEDAGLKGVAIEAKTATAKTFQEIEEGRYQVIVANPEVIMQEGGRFERLWKVPSFTSRLLYVVFDEAHCVSQWSDFREQFKYIGSLRYLIPGTIPFLVASATLPEPVLQDVAEILQLRRGETEYIRRSNDRPDIHLAVHRMEHPANSYRDLAFLIPDNFQPTDMLPPKFLIFFDDRKDTEEAVKYLRSRLPEELRSKIKYFHSVMSPEYREDEYEALRESDLWGLCVTDSFGMGLDLPDITLIVQWRATCDINTLWQRFGRAARSDGIVGTAVLFVEKGQFDEERERLRLVAEARKEKASTSGNAFCGIGGP